MKLLWAIIAYLVIGNNPRLGPDSDDERQSWLLVIGFIA